MAIAEWNESDEALKAYLNQIKHTRLLTFEEEIALSKRIQRGDELAKQKLIESNLRFVIKIAKFYSSVHTHFADLIQEGNFGLVKAASKYDYRKGVRFSTYAAWWIRQAILRFLSSTRRFIRLPQWKEESYRQIQKTYENLAQLLHRKPSLKEVADELDMDEVTVGMILQRGEKITSLDASSSTEVASIVETCGDDTYSPESGIMYESLKKDTMKFLNQLMEQERKILMYRFAFYGGKKSTLKRIGQELGLSPEGVRQIEKRAIMKLRKQVQELQDYMYEIPHCGAIREFL